MIYYVILCYILLSYVTLYYVKYSSVSSYTTYTQFQYHISIDNELLVNDLSIQS